MKEEFANKTKTVITFTPDRFSTDRRASVVHGARPLSGRKALRPQ